MIKKKNTYKIHKLEIIKCKECFSYFMKVIYIKHRKDGFCKLNCLKAFKKNLRKKDRFTKYFKGKTGSA